MEYPSKSSPGKTYQILKGGDGVTYCTCWQWKRTRACKHLEDFFSNYTEIKYIKPDPVPVVFTHVDTYEDGVQKIIEELRT